MAMWNADGSRGAMCGNGLRCLARLAFERRHVTAPRFRVATDAGPRDVEILFAAGSGRIAGVRAAMGEVRCGTPTPLPGESGDLRYVPGDAGNPHAVLFVADVDRADVHGIGARLQRHPDFAGGVNVEFVQVVAAHTLRQRTFERGSGETLACGTGAAVAARAASDLGLVVGDRIAVELRGGTLHVQLDGTSLAIEGPARTVFDGEIELP
jgi:diaminopimelate epimerase